jgi:hypothetical protein
MRTVMRARIGMISSLAVVAMLTVGCAAAPQPTSPSTVVESRLILVQVMDRTNYAVGNALMSGSDAGDERNSAIAYVPASVLVPVATASPPRTITLGATPDEPDTLAPKRSTEAAFDLDLDGSWTLDVLAFAGLVDAVGGVYIDLPEPVRMVNVQSQTTITLTQGRQRLSGIEAAEYVTASVRPTFPVSQLQRFRDVWIAVLARLPESPERLRQIVNSLGFLARTTASVDTLLLVLGSGRAAVLDQAIDEKFVGVDVIRGGVRPASVPTPEGSRTVATMFPDFIAPQGPDSHATKRQTP